MVFQACLFELENIDRNDAQSNRVDSVVVQAEKKASSDFIGIISTVNLHGSGSEITIQESMTL